jgi:hypothetical protein
MRARHRALTILSLVKCRYWPLLSLAGVRTADCHARLAPLNEAAATSCKCFDLGIPRRRIPRFPLHRNVIAIGSLSKTLWNCNTANVPVHTRRSATLATKLLVELISNSRASNRTRTLATVQLQAMQEFLASFMLARAKYYVADISLII